MPQMASPPDMGPVDEVGPEHSTGHDIIRPTDGIRLYLPCPLPVISFGRGEEWAEASPRPRRNPSRMRSHA